MKTYVYTNDILSKKEDIPQPSNSAPMAVDTNVPASGTGDKYSRGDHKHSIAKASTSADGAMSKEDKEKLDSIEIATAVPEDVSTSAGSLGTSTKYAREDHVHKYSGGGYELPIATTSILGGIKPDGTSITVNETTGVATAVAGEPYELPLATTSILGGIKPDGTSITVDPDTGVATAVAGGIQQDPTLLFSGSDIEITQLNAKYNKKIGAVPPHDSVKIFSCYGIFLKDNAFYVEDVINYEIPITTTKLEETINDYLLVGSTIFVIVKDNTIAKWIIDDDDWTIYPLTNYSEIKFVSRKDFNTPYYNIFFVSAKDISGKYKLLKIDSYSVAIEDLNLDEEVVDVSIGSNETIYALTPNALFKSTNPSQGWTKIGDPDELVKNANFIEIYYPNSSLFIITTSDGKILFANDGEIFRVYDGSVPIVAISGLFCLLNDNSIIFFAEKGNHSPYPLGMNAEAIGYVGNYLIVINQIAKYSIMGDIYINCTLQGGYNISQISEGGSASGNSDKYAREDHVHAFHMPIPQKFHKGDGTNITHQMQNAIQKFKLSGSIFKVLISEDKIILCTTDFAIIFNGLPSSSIYFPFKIKDCAYSNNQFLIIDENDEPQYGLFTGYSIDEWKRLSMPPDCVRCINVWSVKSYFLGLFQKADDSFVTAGIFPNNNFVYSVIDEKISFVAEADDYRFVFSGQTKYWFPFKGGVSQGFSADMPSGVTFKKIIRTPSWSVALATDGSKIFITDDFWNGYLNIDVGVPSPITDIYYESSIQLFIAATSDGYLYYEIEDGISFVNYKSIKISDNAIIAVFVLNQKIFAVDSSNSIYTVDIVNNIDVVQATKDTFGGLKLGENLSFNEQTGGVDASGGEPYELPIATTSTLGGIKPDGTSITVNETTGVATAVAGEPYELPIATTSILGGFKPNGTSIIVDPVTGFASLGKGIKPIQVGTNNGVNVNYPGWTQQISGTIYDLDAIIYGNGLFVAGGGNGSILTSPDGITWTKENLSQIYNVDAITYGNGLFVIVGNTGSIFTSPDGITWTPQIIGELFPLYGIIYGNGLFVAVGNSGLDGSIFTSPDGITWTQQQVSDILEDITYGNGLFVAVGDDVITSPDGITWTQQISGTTARLYAITYGNGLFVAVGRNGSILTSPDGITWTQQTSWVSDTLFCITYGNGLFVAGGGNGIILTSPDGITWAKEITGQINTVDGLTYGNGLFVAVGDYGSILTSSVNYYIFGVPPTDSSFGVVRPDGTSIINNDGVISVAERILNLLSDMNQRIQTLEKKAS
jgi:hypothetical protein